MTIDRFQKDKFERALEQFVASAEAVSSFDSLGLVSGEYAYVLRFENQPTAGIMVRSTIDRTGRAKATAEDSIRVWLVWQDGAGVWQPLGNKDGHWITRVHNWDRRLHTKLAKLVDWRMRSGDCPRCRRPLSVFVVKGGKNKGRPFAKCMLCAKAGKDSLWHWLDKPWRKKPFFVEVNNNEADAADSGSQAEGMRDVASPESEGTKPNSVRNSSAGQLGQGSSRGESVGGTESKPDVPDMSRPPSRHVMFTNAGDGDEEEPESEETSPSPRVVFSNVRKDVVSREPNAEQRQAIEAPVDAAVRVLAPPGAGKCLAPGTPVLLFSGNVIPVEEIEVGDKLMGPDSRPRTVLSLAHGYDEMFRVVPVKGDSYTVNKSHILSLKASGPWWKGVTDGDIINLSISEYFSLAPSRRGRLKGWRTGVEFNDVPVSLDPYFLGLWLGDGLKHGARISTADGEILEYLERVAESYGLDLAHRSGYDYALTSHNKTTKKGHHGFYNPISAALRENNLLCNKHIPHSYKCNSREKRLGLLAGLLDSDGYYSQNHYEITQRRKALADDILFLARSLGFAAYMKPKIVNGTVYYRITISGDGLEEIPVKLPRKKAHKRRQIKDALRTGITVQHIGQGEYYGFELDGDGLFLLGDFTVTHNTLVLARRYAYLLEHGARPDDILAVTFSKNMADELLNRIARISPQVLGTAAERQVCTIHAACYRMLRAEGDRRNVPKEWQIKKSLQDIAKSLWRIPNERPGWSELYYWICGAKGMGLTSADDMDLFGGVVNSFGRNVGRELHIVRRRFDEDMRRQRLITFPDMLFDVEQKLLHDRAFREKWQRQFKWIIQDESQDANPQDWRILGILAEPDNRVFVVGDVDQCILEGEVVLTPKGYLPIEEIEKYDKVFSAIGDGKVAPRFVIQTSRDERRVVVVEIRTKAGYSLRATHDHIVFASVVGRSQSTKHHAPKRHYVYVMFKRGYGYRLGTTKNPRNRINGEHADAMWLIRSYDNVTEALYDENLLSARYGIPTMTFVDHVSKDKRRQSANMTQPWIDKLFHELDTESPAMLLALEEGFDFSQLPHIVPQNFGSRVSVCLDFCDRGPKVGRTRKTSHSLSVETSHGPSIARLTESGFDMKKAKKTGWRLRLYSSDIGALERKARMLDAMLEGSLLIRGQFVHKDDYAGNYSLVPQAMPAGNVLPGFYVPVYDEKQGKILLDEVISVKKEKRTATVYDLEVMDTANFIAGGLVVHNCLYGFRGARSENLLTRFDEKYPGAVTVKLSMNYRSTCNIIDTCSRLIQNNYVCGGGPYENKYLKDVQPRLGAPEGEPVTFQMYSSPETESAAVAESIVELLNGDDAIGPSDIFVGARTRAQLGYLEGCLLRQKIPFINIAGGSFWNLRHVRYLVAYLRLAVDEKDNDAFREIFNVASTWMVHPWGEDEGEYCQHRYLGRAFMQACNGSYKQVWSAVSRRRSFRPGVEDLTDFVQELQAEVAAGTPADAAKFVVDSCLARWLKAEEGITATDEAENGKLSDLMTVVDIARQFRTVPEFLEHVAEAVRAAEAAKNKEWDDYVIISTIHRLKGQERRVVYGLGFSEGWQAGHPESPAGLLPHTFSLRPPPVFGVLPTGGQGRIEDERCCAYVLVSRAKERVFLSGCKSYRTSVMQPSRFIGEMGMLENLRDNEENNGLGN